MALPRRVRRGTPVDRARGGCGRPGRRFGGHEEDRGQVMPLAVAMVAIVTVALVGLVPVGHAVRDRARARTAADAAALAGAVDGQEAARELAADNGAVLVGFERSGDEVVVLVRVGDTTARARARATVASTPVPGATGRGGDRAGLAPAMAVALARADALLGHPVVVVSGLRTRAEQQALWDRRHTNPYPVAPPGTSDHERGLAVDVERAAVDELASVAGAAGLCRPLPESDPVHFVVCG